MAEMETTPISPFFRFKDKEKSHFPLIFWGFFFFILTQLSPTEAYDPLDPNGNITIRWDVKQWTADGYVATVTIFNYELYRHVASPGWNLGWEWTHKQVIWKVIGAEATEQGDCRHFKGEIPHCCLKKPVIVDLLPGTPYNMQTNNCCKGGVLTIRTQDPANAASSFEIVVGQSLADDGNVSVSLPLNFKLGVPGPGYTCGNASFTQPTKFPSPGGRRKSQALLTWQLTCTYSSFVAHKTPACCVSLSSFYNSSVIPCPVCSCNCWTPTSESAGQCALAGSSSILKLPSSSSTGITEFPPLVQCTRHMCPIRVHWHVMVSYKLYWRVKITITNFNFIKNYSEWNLVVQHPNLQSLTQVFSFNYKSLDQYGSVNDSGMFWGIKYYNDMLLQGGENGNVQTEMLLRKDNGAFTFTEGWAFPRRIYFNGDDCVMPPPDAFPRLPNSSTAPPGIHGSIGFILLLLFIALLQ